MVRINLSEQTDIADLMGSDLPVQDSSGRGAAFEWSDGVLLRAIKDGSWVLLDELNLASQSVLEGLNSCLDHRATVYIPELGKTFHCPPSFRVFGAQNPLNQGGGRKGLPKSFLNRFTKVYVDALTDADLRTIVKSRYPSFDERQVDGMIDFNNAVHDEVVEKREYGSEGAPWEFNLRDVFRWCQVLESQTSPIQSCARDIYLQRFRNRDDRLRVDLSFQKYFQCSMKGACPSPFQISDSTMQVGDTILSRMGPLYGINKNPKHAQPHLFLSHLLPMEALARCIALRWPCLVIGPPSSGKTSVIAALAETCNTTLVEQCLSPSSDVTELLGCFEQVEGNEFELTTAMKACEIINSFLCLVALKGKKNIHLWNAAARFQKYVEEGRDDNDGPSIRDRASEICILLQQEIKHYDEVAFEPMLKDLQALTLSIGESVYQNDRPNASHFVWRDGILVQAMLHGHWLVLNNVNLCPSSVLDRLNSVMEDDGELLLSECGTLDATGELLHRVIRPHPNFRVFLTMDAANGEVSRAMRNRCVELYFPRLLVSEPGEFTIQKETRVDFLGILHTSGVRSLDLASTIIRSHHEEQRASIGSTEEVCCTRGMVLSTSMAVSMLSRGISGGSVLLDFLQVGYELEEHQAVQRAEEYGYDGLCQDRNDSMVAGGPIRQLWGAKAIFAQVGWEARVLQVFGEESPAVWEELKTLLSLENCDSFASERLKKMNTRSDVFDETYDALSGSLVKNFLTNLKFGDLNVRFHYLDGYQGDFVDCFDWIAKFVKKDLSVFLGTKTSAQSSGQRSAAESADDSSIQDYLGYKTMSLSRQRLDQVYSQKKWLEEMCRKDDALDPSYRMTVLEASYLASESIIDRTKLACPVTPFIYTFFVEIDNFLVRLFHESTRLNPADDHRLSFFVAALLRERDRFWDLLKRTPLLIYSSSFLGFEEAEFLVQWRWLKRALDNIDLKVFDTTASAILSRSTRMDSMISHVDNAIFGTAGDVWSSRAVNKKLMRPRVPREASHWTALFDLLCLAKECSLMADGKFSPFHAASAPIDLTSLLEKSHPLLFMGKGFRSELLGVLATMHSYWTDEVVTDEQVLGHINLDTKLRNLIDARRKEFEKLFARARVDTNINTIENQLTAEKLEELRDSSSSSTSSSEAYCKVANDLLSAFAQIQLSPFEEYQCVVEERNIIGEICRAILHQNDGDIMVKLNDLLPRLKIFMDACLSCVVWSVSHLRPYQTLVWVLESWSEKSGDSMRLMRSLLPQLLSSWSSHMWSNSFNRVGIVATRLELPNLWVDDENSRSPHRIQGLRGGEDTFGSSRIQQKVITEIILLTVGEQFALQSQARRTRFYTVENCEHRIRQYQTINKVISSTHDKDPKSSFWILLCLASDVFKAIRDGLRCKNFDQLVVLMEQPSLLADICLDSLAEIYTISTDRAMSETLLPLVLPLLECFQSVWKSDPLSFHHRKKLDVASIYLGLLRLRFSTPTSPLDPGRAPVAKVSLIDDRLRRLRNEITAQRLCIGFSTGDFSPYSPAVEEMLSEGAHLVTKRISQEHKVVQRPIASTPFHELFRLCRDFSERISSTSAVLELVDLIMNHKDRVVIRRRVDNWLQTSSSFCQRIEADFAGYDDVTMTLLHSIRMIQDGLESLSKCGNAAQSDESTGLLFGKLLQYPMPDYNDTVHLANGLLSKIKEVRGKATERTDFHFAISSVSLSRLLLQKLVFGFEQVDFQNCLAALDSLPQPCDLAFDSQDEGRSLEDIQEQKFREQFPDHRREFTELFQEKDDDDVSDSELIAEETKQGDDREQANLSESQLEWLCLVLRQLFQSEKISLSDSTRTMVFHYGYNAALSLERNFLCTKQDHTFMETMSGHTFAMMLSTPPSHPCPKVYAHLYRDSNIIDFQNEPNPVEVMKAKGPLERLMARSTQLLTAFPGHSILLGIGRVCDRVFKFDIMTTSIGKVMTGLEVILRQAQEWEQHASDRVRLGLPLQEVGKLVASWRKLELESWPQLILARRQRYQRMARKHLMRLLRILRSSSFIPEIGESDQHRECSTAVGASCFAPRWIWKGASAAGQSLSRAVDSNCADDLTALTKILDTFVLTSTLGQFQERLEVLKASANQQEMEFRHSSAASLWTLQQSRALWSVHAYYQQFEPIVNAKIDSMIAPIQGKLKDEVKLAKWDEQTYYALAESTEKNHRKLMKVLAEVDDCLDFNVGQLIQEEKIKGIRGNVDSTGDVSTSVPSDSAIFPHVEKTAELETLCDQSDGMARVTSNQIWTDPVNIKAALSNSIVNIANYAKKMENLQISSKDRSNWAKLGLAESSYLCGAIFERISSLRSKSSRPMKERALTDLFRELRRNGFTTTKWAVPEQLRKMEELFQLPKANVEDSGVSTAVVDECRRGEMYYQRSLTELNEYRSESIILGSKHLSKRETDLMLTLGESGMLLIAQQRCLLASISCETKKLNDCLSILSFDERRLPLGQSTKLLKLMEFEASYLLAIETLRQLSLFVKSSHPLFDGTDAHEWARDTTCKVDGCVDILEGFGSLGLETTSILTNAQIQQVERKLQAANDAHRVVNECRRACGTLACLPVDGFDVALGKLDDVSRKLSITDADVAQGADQVVEPFIQSLSSTIERCLIGFQSFVKGLPEDEGTNEDASLWKCHRELINLWGSTHIAKLKDLIAEIIEGLKNLHDAEGDLTGSDRETFVGIAVDVGTLAGHVHAQAMALFETTVYFHSHTSKLVYILLRVFRVLLSKGFCSDETAEDEGSNSGGDVQGMTFEDDQDGTGMGEGDGKRDVTDQLESEEQLTGLKNDQQDGEKDENRDSRQLNEEEANEGMEMEADFEGEMCDVPDKPHDDKEEDAEGEELDREMGDEASPDEQVVDERMWNDSDDEDEIKKDEEKFEKDSGVEGEAIEGATRTKDDDDKKDNDKTGSDGKEKDGGPSEMQEEKAPESDMDDDGDINEDNDDRYEDQHGVDVQGEERKDDENLNADEQMLLDDDINLDGDDNLDPAMDEATPEDGDGDDQSEPGGEADEAILPSNPDLEEETKDDIDQCQDAAAPSGSADRMDEKESPDQEDEPNEDETAANVQNQKPSEEEAHGVRAKNGAEGILDDGGEDEDDGKMDETEGGGDTSGSRGGAQSQSETNGGSGISEQDGAVDEAQKGEQEDSRDEIPNPFKNPGDASKFWHKKLNIVESDEKNEESNNEQDETDVANEGDHKGDFQYTANEEESPTQVLGETTEEEAIKLNQPDEDTPENQESEPDMKSDESKKKDSSDPEQRATKKQKRQPASQQYQVEDPEEQDMSDDEHLEDALDEHSDKEDHHSEDLRDDEVIDDDIAQSRVVSDLSRLKVEGQEPMIDICGQMIEDEQVTGISSSEAAEARMHWLHIQSETYSLSRRLCEKLRLVMEPLVASKLRGDYRTGKRINMKRVIGYIASGYRKDKIWLRRTKPAKRDYRVLLAVDDSESMKKSGSGEMALRALATLAVGMNQLEIGELGIASFGEDMKLLHPFHLPFSADSGADMVMNFKFDQKRTRTSLCVESAIAALESTGGHSSMQLVFLVSDGRIERDSRDKLKRLIREMMERNILLAMIIVEGEHKKKDSIVNMKEVTFEKGKPVVKRFIEDYPFPYYIILDDMTALPEVLGDALRQWFEMLSQMQSPR